MKNLTIFLRAFGIAAIVTTLVAAQDLHTIFPLPPPSVSTIAANGDVNPYGLAFAPKNLGAGWTLQPGDILVSNFNDLNNLQGRGSTIVRVDKAGRVSTFYNGPQQGMTAALGVLSNGMVLVGNLPTVDGTPATLQRGALSLLNGNGQFLGTLGATDTVNSPWGMAVSDAGNGVSGAAHVFISNVVAGTIARLDMTYSASNIGSTATLIASGLNHRPDPAALVLGPSGLAYDSIHDLLYVASSLDNAIYTIANASTLASAAAPQLLSKDLAHLHGPLDITILPNGHLVVANSDGSNTDPNQPSELVEYTPQGQFLGQTSLDPNNGGAFGVSTYNVGWGTFRMAAVDDNANSLRLWTLVAQ